MREAITQLDASTPLVNQHSGLPYDQFRIFLLQVQQTGLMIGSGSPAGVIEAQQGRFYMDEDAAAGSVLYAKQKADIGGDKTQGWVLIG